MRAFVPEAVNIPDRKMLVINTVGDPSNIGEAHFNSLYGTAYGTKFKTFKPRGIKLQLGKLCALWPDAHLKPKSEWTGVWAIPVPDFVTEQDLVQKTPDYPVRLEIWPGGLYGQVLHKGTYAEEGPTVALLHRFIENELGVSMKDIVGIHEEEYLTKPDTKNQKTIIRYLVRSSE